MSTEQNTPAIEGLLNMAQRAEAQAVEDLRMAEKYHNYAVSHRGSADKNKADADAYREAARILAHLEAARITVPTRDDGLNIIPEHDETLCTGETDTSCRECVASQ